jgi:hypothetical protein
MTMAQSFMEMIYIDKEDNARQTGLRRSAETNAATLAEFRRWRLFGVDIKQARFLLDYHNAKGDLSDTIALDEAGFRSVTGLEPGDDEHYQAVDIRFWEDVRSAA